MQVLITGAGGYIGRQVAQQLATRHQVIGIDLRADPNAGFDLREMDIRDPKLRDLVVDNAITHVVHLAAVLEFSGDRARDYDIDVNGTRNVLDACLAGGVQHVTVTSSGAAYGYYADNPQWISETDRLRGNVEMPYADHKRQVEELLAGYRAQHPDLAQLILRVGTVIGAGTRNLITNLFEKKRLLAIRGYDSPFVFIWDQDLVGIISHGVETGNGGIYNVAGDGCLTMDELGQLLDKPVLKLPAPLIVAGLKIGRKLGLTRYAPEQIKFIQYRPVLDNRRLKEDFGYRPAKTSREAFLHFRDHGLRRR
jgi:UDP-glucose 4-epimerase